MKDHLATFSGGGVCDEAAREPGFLASALDTLKIL